MNVKLMAGALRNVLENSLCITCSIMALSPAPGWSPGSWPPWVYLLPLPFRFSVLLFAFQEAVFLRERKERSGVNMPLVLAPLRRKTVLGAPPWYDRWREGHSSSACPGDISSS
jgi:hypothetical protein